MQFGHKEGTKPQSRPEQLYQYTGCKGLKLHRKLGYSVYTLGVFVVNEYNAF